MYHSFVGIDISKNDFAVCVHGNNKVTKYANTQAGFELLLSDYPVIDTNALVVLETTGGYEKALLSFLLSHRICVHRANTRVVKHFIRSTGRLGKSDSIDAKGLARFAYERSADLACYQPQEEMLERLVKLTLRKQDLKKLLVAEKNRYQAPDQAITRDSHQRVIDFLKQEIASIESLIAEIIGSCSYLKKAKELLVKEVDGLGDASAMALLALIPELGKLNRKQVASLSGVAPHPYESGKKIGYRSTYGGRQDIKPILFMSALTAARSKGRLGQFYRHLLENNAKKKMVALVAVMRKIIVIANAKIRDLRAELGLINSQIG